MRRKIKLAGIFACVTALGLMMTGARDLSEVNGKIAGIAKDSAISEEDGNA